MPYLTLPDSTCSGAQGIAEELKFSQNWANVSYAAQSWE